MSRLRNTNIMRKTTLFIVATALLSLGLKAQVCDPSVAPTGLVSTYTPGSGALLEWDAVPGSVGVQFQAALPSGAVISRRFMGLDFDQLFIPDVRLSPGTYMWRVQAACSTVPPYDVTPISASNSFTVGGGSSCPATVTDIDGNMYSTVQIGSQCWMAENLKVEQYSNGDALLTPLLGASSSGAYSVYDNLDSNKATYGLLYNWYAVDDARGLCPSGWHVPTDSEWTQMLTVLDPSTCESCTGASHSSTAGGQMKTTGTLEAGTGLWLAPNTAATNSSGFSGLPGGLDGAGGQGFIGVWWSSSMLASFEAWSRELHFNNGGVNRGFGTLNMGFSVRCIQD